MKKLITSMLIIAIPYAANAADLMTDPNAPANVPSIQAKNVTAGGDSMKHITNGPKNSYEVAALFNILEKKGIISKDELSKEIQSLDIKQFSDPSPYISIR